MAGKARTIRLPWPAKGLSPNDRVSRWTEARARKNYRHDAFYLAREAGVRPAPGATDVRVDLTFHPKTANLPDEDNCVARMKAAFDGIADALGVDDRIFRLGTTRIAEPVRNGCVLVRLEIVDG